MAASSLAQATAPYDSESCAERHPRPHTPPIPYFHSPFNHSIAPPAPLNFSGGPLVLADSAIAGGTPSFQRSEAERPVHVGYKQSDSVRLTITKHRWKEVTDFLNGDIPVIEIRPYNKCDGKRYVYVRVDRVTSEPVNLKARFRLRKATNGEWLGYLTRSTAEITQEPGLTFLSSFDVDVTGNLTLLISEPILRKLDTETSGRSNAAPAEQELQIVVSTKKRDVYQEIAVLPFFRVKRKHKRTEKLVALDAANEPSLCCDMKKRPRTLSSEKHHPIPNLSSITSSAVNLVAVQNNADSDSVSLKGRDLAAADSFLMLSVDDYENRLVPNVSKQARNETLDDDCDVMNFIPPSSYNHFEL